MNSLKVPSDFLLISGNTYRAYNWSLFFSIHFIDQVTNWEGQSNPVLKIKQLFLFEMNCSSDSQESVLLLTSSRKIVLPLHHSSLGHFLSLSHWKMWATLLVPADTLHQFKLKGAISNSESWLRGMNGVVDWESWTNFQLLSVELL